MFSINAVIRYWVYIVTHSAKSHGVGGPVLFLFPCHLSPLSHWQSLLSKETVTALWHTKPTLGGFNKETSAAPALLANFKCTCMHVLPCFSSSPFVSLIVSIAGGKPFYYNLHDHICFIWKDLEERKLRDIEKKKKQCVCMLLMKDANERKKENLISKAIICLL